MRNNKSLVVAPVVVHYFKQLSLQQEATLLEREMREVQFNGERALKAA